MVTDDQRRVSPRKQPPTNETARTVRHRITITFAIPAAWRYATSGNNDTERQWLITQTTT